MKSESTQPGPMEQYLLDQINRPQFADTLDFARAQDSDRAALLAALIDCQAILQDIGYEAPRNGDPETQVRLIEDSTGVDIIDICIAADRAAAAIDKVRTNVGHESHQKGDAP